MHRLPSEFQRHPQSVTETRVAKLNFNDLKMWYASGMHLVRTGAYHASG